MSNELSPLNFENELVDGQRKAIDWFQIWMGELVRKFAAISSVPTVVTVVTDITKVPDASTVPIGTQYFVGTPYFHLVISDGAKWRFAGDQPGFWEGPFDPGTNGYHALDGSVGVTYLVANAATLSTAAITLPNEVGGEVHVNGVYDHLVNAATAPVFTGTPVNTGAPNSPYGGVTGVAALFANSTHTHSVTAAGTVDATGTMANVKVVRKFRR
jgi:hypothetical protein